MYTTVIIEDDPMITRLNRRYIEQDSRFAVVQTFSAAHPALFWLRRNPIDLIILDVYMPQMSGTELLLQLRAEGVDADVIMVTSANDAKTVNDAVRLGAVDYLVKPFYIRELLARVRALTRRPHEMKEQDILMYQDLRLERSNRKLQANGKEILLTAKETELLYTLLKLPETLLTREQLVLKVWGTDSDIEPGNVDNYISFLRKRLKELNSICEIKTIYGSGYQLRCSLC